MKRHLHRAFLGLTVASLMLPEISFGQDEDLPRALRVERITGSEQPPSPPVSGTTSTESPTDANSTPPSRDPTPATTGANPKETAPQEESDRTSVADPSGSVAPRSESNRAAPPTVLHYGPPVRSRGWYDNRHELVAPHTSTWHPAPNSFVRPARHPSYLHVSGSHPALEPHPDTCATGCLTTPGTWLTGLDHWFLPSDHQFDDFVSPLSNPVYFEDPRTLTELRFIYLRQKVPLTAVGGEVQVFAMQARAALTDRLSIIATKDGFITSSNPLIEDGWADVNVGLKYNLLTDPDAGRILSGGLTYEIPLGSTRTLQGNGDGVFHPFLTGGLRIGNGHLMSATGLLLPADPAAESRVGYWSNHLDGRIGQSHFFWVGELNWYHWLGAGQQTSVKGIPVTGLEGGDLFNLGLAGVSGNDIVTAAVGLRYKPSGHLELGLAWEAPLTERRDLLDNRLTVDCILRY